MAIFGPLSSAFDFVTFTVLIAVFDARSSADMPIAIDTMKPAHRPGDVGLQPWATGRSVWVALVEGATTGRRIRKDEAFGPTGPRSGFEVDWAV